MTDLNKIANHPLQTTFWAEFRKKWGNEVLETPYGIITTHPLPFTSYRIGVFEKGPEPSPKMLSDLRVLAKKEKLIFIKLEPNVIKSEKLKKIMTDSGCKPGKTVFTPSTFWVDLAPSEDDLMKSFNSKTRYNIRLASKKGVVVKEDNSDKAFEKYLELTRETASRQGFFAHNQKYHRLMWKYLHQLPITHHKEPIAHLFTARYKGQVITTWILFVWKNYLYYPYGASTEEHKQVMANNLMMWEAIRFGKRHRLKIFDLWGREEGTGFTKFKEGYNPSVIEFLGTWDLIINAPLYRVYRFTENLRWKFLKTFGKFGLSKLKF